MIIFDIIVLIILIFFIIKGLKNGLIVEIGSFVALIAGFFLTTRFSYLVYNLLEGKDFPGAEFLPTISYIITFIIIVILVFLVAKLFTKIAKIIKINWLNKLLGSIFGTLKGLIIIGGAFVFINILISYGLFSNIDFSKSYSFNPILKFVELIFPMFPF